jgi:hypothetical protein
MRSTIIISATLFCLSFLPAMAAARHDLSFYLNHPQQLHDTLSACQDDPGDLASTPDCINAQDAQQEITLSSL